MSTHDPLDDYTTEQIQAAVGGYVPAATPAGWQEGSGFCLVHLCSRPCPECAGERGLGGHRKPWKPKAKHSHYRPAPWSVGWYD